MSAEHFPPLSSRHNITKIAFGLPKHSQPSNEILEKRLQCQHLPPIASLGTNSMVIGSLPLNFTWNSSRDMQGRIRDIDQIIDELKPPIAGSENTQPYLGDADQKIPTPNPPLLEQRCEQGGEPSLLCGRKTTKRAQKLDGAACVGPTIKDLFSHSYSLPPPDHTNSHSSRWV